MMLWRPGGFLVAQMEVPAEETWAVLRRAKAAGMHTVLNLAPAARCLPSSAFGMTGFGQ